MIANDPQKLNNSINACLINLNFILYHAFSLIFKNIDNITRINNIIINRKIVHVSI